MGGLRLRLGGAAAPTLGYTQVVRDLAYLVTTSGPPGGLEPQLFAPLLLGERVPAPLRIPHAPVIRPQPADVTTCTLRISPG